MVLGRPGGKKFHLPKSQTKFRVPKESGGVNKKFKPLHPIASSVTRNILLDHESSSRGGEPGRPMSLSQGSISSKKPFSLSKNRLYASQSNEAFRNKGTFNVKSHNQKNKAKKTLEKSELGTKDQNSNSNFSHGINSNVSNEDDLNTTIDENETGGSQCNEEDSTPISSYSPIEESVSDAEENPSSTQDTVLLPSSQEMNEDIFQKSSTAGNTLKDEMSLTRKGEKDSNIRSKNKKDSRKKMKMMERNIAQRQSVQKKKKEVTRDGAKVRKPIKKKSTNKNQTLNENERQIDKSQECQKTSFPMAPHTLPTKPLKEYKIKGKYKKIIDEMEKEREKGTYVECCQCKKWRYLRRVLDPSTVPEFWACTDNPDSRYNSCSVPQANLNTILDDEWVENTFTTGSLVWAKIEKDFDWWPAMIDDDPDTGKFCWIEESESNVPLWYHVLFFNRYEDLVARSWIKSEYVVNFAEESLSSYKVESSYLQGQAIKEMLSAKLLPLKERRKKYGYIFRYKGFWKLPWDKKLWGNTGESSEANNSNYTSTSCDDESESEATSSKTAVHKQVTSINESSSEEENVEKEAAITEIALNNQDKTFNNEVSSHDEVVCEKVLTQSVSQPSWSEIDGVLPLTPNDTTTTNNNDEDPLGQKDVNNNTTTNNNQPGVIEE